MSEDLVVLCRGLTPAQSGEVMTLLTALAIESRIELGSGRTESSGHAVRVPAADFAKAWQALRAQHPELARRRRRADGGEVTSSAADDLDPTAARGDGGEYGDVGDLYDDAEPDDDEDDEEDDELERAPSPSLSWNAPGALPVVGAVALLCVAVFASVQLAGHSPPTREEMLRHGAISWSQVHSGEYWRLLTGVFLHFDGVHLLANLTTLFLVGPPLAGLLGPARFLGVFVATGIAGNLLSHVVSAGSLALKAGASGAIAGLLGGLAGQQLRASASRRTRFKRWQVLGGLAAVYALLVGTGPGRDDLAHLGGLIAGVVLGRIIPPRDEASPARSPRQ